MSSPASKAGFSVGKTYRLLFKDVEYSEWPAGSILKFVFDDQTDVPKFENSDGDQRYVPLECFAPTSVSKVTFTDEAMTVYKTVINAGRLLNQAEKDAIQRIINQGV